MVSAGRVAGCRPRLNGRDRSSAATGRARPLESAAHGARVFCKLQRCGYGNLDLDGLGASSAGPPPTNEARRRGNGAGDDLLGSAVMQMVERPWGITAFGAASVKAVPDLVRIRFKVVRVEQSPTAAFEAARAAVRAVRGALREHGIGDAAVEGSRLDLKNATEYVDGDAQVRRLPVPGRLRGRVRRAGRR